MIKTKTKKTASAYSPTIKPLKTAYRSQCKLVCQPLPGAGMNICRYGLDDLVVGVSPRFGEARAPELNTENRKKVFDHSLCR